jgi:uncharacterized protein (TIGR03000 family)
MFRNIFSLTALVLLAGALVAWTAEPALAAPHHAGHAGFVHHGGFVHPAHIGAFNARPFYGYHNYYSPYSGRRYYPYLGSYYYPYMVYPSFNYFVNPYTLYSVPSAIVGSSYPEPDIFTTPAPRVASTDTTARIIVRLPANAELWFEGQKMTGTGSVREFESPPLTPGQRYTYEVRAQWEDNGKLVKQTQTVGVKARAFVNVDFPVAPPEKGTP